jgi:hypothetical protein
VVYWPVIIFSVCRRKRNIYFSLVSFHFRHLFLVRKLGRGAGAEFAKAPAGISAILNQPGTFPQREARGLRPSPDPMEKPPPPRPGGRLRRLGYNNSARPAAPAPRGTIGSAWAPYIS